MDGASIPQSETPVEMPRAASPAKPQRLTGVVHIYLRDQGIGFIRRGEREFHFGVTDFVGTEHPVEGDRVSFLPQLQSDQYRARRIQILTESTPRAAPNNQRLAQEVRPESAEIVRAARVRAPVDRPAQSREHVRCGGCRRLVIPKMVRVKGGLWGRGGSRWVESCPRCKGSLDGKTSSLKMLWGATLALLAGALVVVRGFLF